jgi:hypothetical protein
MTISASSIEHLDSLKLFEGREKQKIIMIENDLA